MKKQRKEEETRIRERETQKMVNPEVQVKAEGPEKEVSETDEQKMEKRMCYVYMFVEMQKKAREENKERRKQAREARELRTQQKRALNEKSVETTPPVPAAVPLDVGQAKPPPKTSQPPLPKPLEKGGNGVQSNTAQEPVENDVDREIAIIIEIGTLKEDIEKIKSMCESEETLIAELKLKIQLKEAQVAAQKQRGWISGGGSSGPVTMSARNKALLSTYHHSDVTKRPMMGSARYLLRAPNRLQYFTIMSSEMILYLLPDFFQSTLQQAGAVQSMAMIRTRNKRPLI